MIETPRGCRCVAWTAFGCCSLRNGETPIVCAKPVPRRSVRGAGLGRGLRIHQEGSRLGASGTVLVRVFETRRKCHGSRARPSGVLSVAGPVLSRPISTVNRSPKRRAWRSGLPPPRVSTRTPEGERGIKSILATGAVGVSLKQPFALRTRAPLKRSTTGEGPSAGEGLDASFRPRARTNTRSAASRSTSEARRNSAYVRAGEPPNSRTASK